MSKRHHHPKGAQHSASDANKLHAYHLNGKPSESGLPDIAPSQVGDIQGQLMRAGFAIGTPKHPDGKDGKIGWLTFDALNHVAEEAKVNLHDVSFRNQNAEYKQFMSALDKHVEGHDKVVAQLQQPSGPSAEEKAAAEARRQAEEARRLAAEAEAGIPKSIRNTQYDPRYLAKVSDAELNNILKDGLHGIGEIKGGIFGSYHRNGELGDVTTEKVFKEQRRLLGTPDQNVSLDRKALEATAVALGQEVVRKNGYALAEVPMPAQTTGDAGTATLSGDSLKLSSRPVLPQDKQTGQNDMLGGNVKLTYALETRDATQLSPARVPAEKQPLGGKAQIV